MLLQFNFKNFKSFRDEATLDMTATGISEFKFHVAEIGNEKVLPVAAIYGANASGKTNIIDAMYCMASYVVLSAHVVNIESSIADNLMQTMMPAQFAFDSESAESETTFEVYFLDNENGWTYNYGFSLLNGKVSEEWLNYKTKSARGKDPFQVIYYRLPEKNVLEFKNITEKQQENIRSALRPETLILSLTPVLNIGKLVKVWLWFGRTQFVNYAETRSSNYRERQLPEGFAEDEAVQRDVVRYLSAFDSSIVGFHVEAIKEDKRRSEKRYRIEALHRSNDTDELVAIPLEDESAGTLKMFRLYLPLQRALSMGSVMLIDELNARLHPLLVRNLVIAFLDREVNPNHAQLVFTTHDAWQLNNDMLRRDEVWLTEKDDDGASSLYSLADFEDVGGNKIRKDENYEKNYLLGKYGAIPEIKSFDLKEGVPQ